MAIAMASSIFLPSVPQLAADLNSTETIINVTIAIFILVIGFAPIIWSPLSGFYGRKPIYLASMPITIAGSIGVALSRNVGDVIGTRILQGIGSSCVLAVGAGTIGDIFR
jgi:MFS family permease